MLTSRHAWADRAAADTLFQEARTLAQEKDFARACPKFAASQELDPKPGRLLALGDCYEQKGDTASAWSTFREAASAARVVQDDAREKEAIRRADQLEPNLSKLVVNVPQTTRADGLEVRRNGNVVVEALWGSAFPVDPGPQLIEATAPGRVRWSRVFDVPATPGTTTTEVPALEAIQVRPEKPPPPPEGKKKSLPLIVSGGVIGLVGIGTGVGLVAAGSGAANEALTLRDGMPEAVCNTAHPQHAEHADDCRTLADKLAQKDALVNVGAGVLVVGGIFAAVTLVYVLLPSPKQNTMGFQVAPVIAPGLSGLSARGHF